MWLCVSFVGQFCHKETMWTALQSHQWGFNTSGWNWPYYLQGSSASLCHLAQCVVLLTRCRFLHMYCKCVAVTTYSCFLTDFKSKFEVERKDTDGYNSSATPGSQPQHISPLLPLPTPTHPFPSSSSSPAGVSGTGGVPIATPAHLPDSTTDSWSGYYSTQRQDGVGKPFNKSAVLKQRCRDYDGKNWSE